MVPLQYPSVHHTFPSRSRTFPFSFNPVLFPFPSRARPVPVPCPSRARPVPVPFSTAPHRPVPVQSGLVPFPSRSRPVPVPFPSRSCPRPVPVLFPPRSRPVPVPFRSRLVHVPFPSIPVPVPFPSPSRPVSLSSRSHPLPVPFSFQFPRFSSSFQLMTRFYMFRFVSVCFQLSRPILLSISFIRVHLCLPFLPYPSRSRSLPVPLISVSFHVSPFTVPGSPPILHSITLLC